MKRANLLCYYACVFAAASVFVPGCGDPSSSNNDGNVSTCDCEIAEEEIGDEDETTCTCDCGSSGQNLDEETDLSSEEHEEEMVPDLSDTPVIEEPDVITGEDDSQEEEGDNLINDQELPDTDGTECVCSFEDSCCDGCFPINEGEACVILDNLCVDSAVCQNGICTPETWIDCNDGNSCTKDTCVPPLGCVYQYHTNGTVCNDGNVCTLGDHCVNGACQPTESLVCTDDNICTDDVCDPVAGCVSTYNTIPCNDNNVCTSGDHCTKGACTGGTSINCDDSNVCTTDACDPKTGCVYVPNTLPCDDNNKCTAKDHCSQGKCVGTLVNCDDYNVCTTDACDPEEGCIYTYNTLSCDDGNECTINDRCSKGTCVAGSFRNCDDYNICTTDACDTQKGCIYMFNTLPCDDGNPLTVNDHCVEGKCEGTIPPIP